jgi:hypothetical protein
MTIRTWRAMPWLGAAIGAAAMLLYLVPCTSRQIREFQMAEERVSGESWGTIIGFGIVFVACAAGAGSALFFSIRGPNPDD